MTPAGSFSPTAVHLPEPLAAAMQSVRAGPDLVVALSGGLDSIVLLHAAVGTFQDSGRKLSAIHINHQLQPNATEVEQFCRELCAGLGVPLTVERVNVPLSTDEQARAGGLEEAARDVRYRAFEQHLQDDSMLLLGHHGDDQIETVLFRFLRGTGVAGLGGMPRERALGRGRLYRPLLEFSRQQLEQWASVLQLQWIDDPSNVDHAYDRNFLRGAVIPPLKTRWPNLFRRMQSTSNACRESAQLAASLARLHYNAASDSSGNLSVEVLLSLSVAEQKNLLRWWVEQRGYRPPTLNNWPVVLQQLLTAGRDREPELNGEGFDVRRFQERLYIVPNSNEIPARPLPLTPDHPVVWLGQQLRLEPTATAARCVPNLQVMARQGGERVRESPKGRSRPLKKWLQEKAVPPWERAWIPLVYDADELVGVGHLWLSPRYSGPAPESGWRIIWERESD